SDRVPLPVQKATAVVAAQLTVRPAQIGSPLRAPALHVPAVAGQVLGDLREAFVDPGLLGAVAAADSAAAPEVEQVLQLVGDGGRVHPREQILRRITVHAAGARIVQVDDLAVV